MTQVMPKRRVTDISTQPGRSGMDPRGAAAPPEAIGAGFLSFKRAFTIDLPSQERLSMHIRWKGFQASKSS
jgi:hypothetical protein